MLYSAEVCLTCWLIPHFLLMGSIFSGGCLGRPWCAAGHPWNAPECQAVTKPHRCICYLGRILHRSSSVISHVALIKDVYILRNIIPDHWRCHLERLCFFRISRGLGRRPALAAEEPGPFQPNHSITTFLANISPKPSITPFTNGRRRLTARDDTKAVTLVRVDKEESKMASVTETGGLGAGGSFAREGVSACSGNANEGKDEVMEGTSSHFCDSSVVVSGREGILGSLSAGGVAALT